MTAHVEWGCVLLLHLYIHMDASIYNLGTFCCIIISNLAKLYCFICGHQHHPRTLREKWVKPLLHVKTKGPRLPDPSFTSKICCNQGTRIKPMEPHGVMCKWTGEKITIRHTLSCLPRGALCWSSYGLLFWSQVINLYVIVSSLSYLNTG